MFESLQMIYERLVERVQTQSYRYLYAQFNLNNRLTGLVGARGVGKTTLLLQYIREHFYGDPAVFYFSADHIYFKDHTLYEFVEDLYLKRGVSYFFIDEIHKYINWSQELKNLYDGFPDLIIVFSGSSSLDLVKGGYDLSRRAKMYYLSGLSFREYLNMTKKTDFFAISFDELLNKPTKLSKMVLENPGLIGSFHDYLSQGFYPFFQEDPLSYYEKILTIIDKTIHEDIANFYNLRTLNLRHFGKIMNFLASMPPGKISTYNLGKSLQIDDKTASHYLEILKETGLAEIIYPSEPGNSGLRKPEKVFFNNTNLHYAIQKQQASPIDMGAIRELAFVQALKHAGLTVHAHGNGDYQVRDTVFEVGGKNKTRHQIKHIEGSFLVKDDISMVSKGVIPLMYFGFLY